MELSQQTREALAAKILDDSVKLEVSSAFEDWQLFTGTAIEAHKLAMIVSVELRIAPNTIKVEACDLPKPVSVDDRDLSIVEGKDGFSVCRFARYNFKTRKDAQQVAGFLKKTFRSE